MHLQEFEQWCRHLALQEAPVVAAELAAGWQQLARRLDQLPLNGQRSASLSYRCIDLPGPHGGLGQEASDRPQS
ncbi:hypothetical protein J0X19_21230 [Hymenobacter sp. BT186]|uniref:Uncharacterized protein n=1 Tax=Hymenobacter telluris TaxID=2816474 RepID=A0A939EZT2_9BACT|nr:hypothetical protein [Hymenobacter telluris]MBO0360498.1 hypothetical protein [Hymenobacter telluris]MBW3376525.1 hypothetical protein [Hymenobacter norwichensis]